MWLYSVVAEKQKNQRHWGWETGRAEATFWKMAGGREVWIEKWTQSTLSQSGPLSPHGCCPHTPVPPEASREASHRRYAGTVTSPFLFTGTLLDPEGLYDEEVCTPDNLQKYAIPNPPTCFRQFLKKPVHRLLFNISQIEGWFMDWKKTPNKQTKHNFFTQGYLGKRKKREGKVAASLSLIELAQWVKRGPQPQSVFLCL